MQNPNAVVSTVIRFAPPLDRPPAEAMRTGRGLEVELEGGRRARLDPANPRSAGYAQILDGLSRLGMPVYLEVDAATSAITHLLIPLVSRVVGLRPVDTGVLGVELEQSHGRHVLRDGTPDFADIERQLRDALRTGARIILTETDAHEIIDVRVFRPNPDGPTPPFPEVPPRPPWPLDWIREILRPIRHWWWWPWWPWRWFGCMSQTMAQQLFDAMKATSCDPLTVPAPCIPFLYPDNGCWARAHEMCRLIIAAGHSPKKVWIHGNLYVSTKNKPTCELWWSWHVAPIVCVRGPLFFQSRYMVIDPSLFSAPVDKPTWKSVQGDPNATLTDTDASYYFFSGSTDPTYSQTNTDLAFYRLQLLNRALQFGPPPYANCP